MGSKWRKAKIALGRNLCVYVPGSHDDASPSMAADSAARFSDSFAVSPAASGELDPPPKMPTTPTPSSSGLRLSKSGSRSSKVVFFFFFFVLLHFVEMLGSFFLFLVDVY